MIDQLHNLLDTLKLRHTRETLVDALKAAQQKKPSYSRFLLELLSQEHQDKRNRSIANRINRSGLEEFWELETFPYHIQRAVKKQTINGLADLDFIDQGKSVVFIGQPGYGKTGLASGILLKALYAGKSGYCIKAQDLFDELDASQADRSTRHFIKRLSRVDLLLLDEFGYTNPLRQVQINNFFRLMHNRCGRRSMLITTNLGYTEWGKFLGDAPLVAALLSRLLQKCQTISITKGTNLRDPKHGLPTSAPAPQVLKSLQLP
ncbi:MAG: hypothetical protein AUJ52_06610 [Elusimicrobia bacterium CG1_02_63_36]|nr:MAG: hypothetical protein AUJ52_06610 [Elusimicrobia bacterium CG1_02_63_36]